MQEIYIQNYLKNYQHYKHEKNVLSTAIHQNFSCIEYIQCNKCKKFGPHFIEYEELKFQKNNYLLFNIKRTFFDQNLKVTYDFSSIEFKEVYKFNELIPNGTIYSINELGEEFEENLENYSFLLKAFINREGDEESGQYTTNVLSPIFSIKGLTTFPLLKQIFRLIHMDETKFKDLAFPDANSFLFSTTKISSQVIILLYQVKKNNEINEEVSYVSDQSQNQLLELFKRHPKLFHTIKGKFFDKAVVKGISIHQKISKKRSAPIETTGIKKKKPPQKNIIIIPPHQVQGQGQVMIPPHQESHQEQVPVQVPSYELQILDIDNQSLNNLRNLYNDLFNIKIKKNYLNQYSLIQNIFPNYFCFINCVINIFVHKFLTFFQINQNLMKDHWNFFNLLINLKNNKKIEQNDQYLCYMEMYNKKIFSLDEIFVDLGVDLRNLDTFLGIMHQSDALNVLIGVIQHYLINQYQFNLQLLETNYCRRLLNNGKNCLNPSFNMADIKNLFFLKRSRNQNGEVLDISKGNNFNLPTLIQLNYRHKLSEENKVFTNEQLEKIMQESQFFKKKKCLLCQNMETIHEVCFSDFKLKDGC